MTNAFGSSGPLDQNGQPILDRLAFERLTATHRRELKLHCYRMMGSLHEADDLVQDTFLRAWRARADFDGRGTVRGWLYTIATNSCLNALKTRSRTRRLLQQPGRAASQGPATGGPTSELIWLEPYPNAELPDPADTAPGPEARYETHEAVKLAFVAAIQFLPAKQRAALLLCDVVGWSAAETAQLLDSTTASTNSALQRARATLAARYPLGRPNLWSEPSLEDRALLEKYMQAWQSGNLNGFIALLREDATYNMPPWGEWYQGRTDIGAFFATVWTRFTGYRAVAVGANCQPAVAIYACTQKDPTWQAHSLHVIELGQDGIAALTVYVGPLGPNLFAAFGLPPVQ